MCRFFANIMLFYKRDLSVLEFCILMDHGMNHLSIPRDDCTYIHGWSFTHTHVLCEYIYMCTYKLMYMNIYVNICITCVTIYKYVHIHAYMYILYIYLYMYIYVLMHYITYIIYSYFHIWDLRNNMYEIYFLKLHSS